MPAQIVAVLIHVGDVAEGIAWYGRAFPDAQRHRVDGADFEYLKLGGTQLEIVLADEKVASGAAGTVVYWSVEDINDAVMHFHALGAQLYRGPMQIESSLWMCQVRDPWGNCIGLRGPRPVS